MKRHCIFYVMTLAFLSSSSFTGDVWGANTPDKYAGKNPGGVPLPSKNVNTNLLRPGLLAKLGEKGFSFDKVKRKALVKEIELLATEIKLLTEQHGLAEAAFMNNQSVKDLKTLEDALQGVADETKKKAGNKTPDVLAKDIETAKAAYMKSKNINNMDVLKANVATESSKIADLQNQITDKQRVQKEKRQILRLNDYLNWMIVRYDNDVLGNQAIRLDMDAIGKDGNPKSGIWFPDKLTNTKKELGKLLKTAQKKQNILKKQENNEGVGGLSGKDLLLLFQELGDPIKSTGVTKKSLDDVIKKLQVIQEKKEQLSKDATEDLDKINGFINDHYVLNRLAAFQAQYETGVGDPDLADMKEITGIKKNKKNKIHELEEKNAKDAYEKASVEFSKITEKEADLASASAELRIAELEHRFNLVEFDKKIDAEKAKKATPAQKSPDGTMQKTPLEELQNQKDNCIKKFSEKCGKINAAKEELQQLAFKKKVVETLALFEDVMMGIKSDTDTKNAHDKRDQDIKDDIGEGLSIIGKAAAIGDNNILSFIIGQVSKTIMN